MAPDGLPERTVDRDTGCTLQPSCLICALPACRYDRARAWQTQQQVIPLRDTGKNADEVAAELAISRRTVYRRFKR